MQPEHKIPNNCDPTVPKDVELYEISKEIARYEVLRTNNQYHEANQLKQKIEEKLLCNPKLAEKINFITEFPK